MKTIYKSSLIAVAIFTIVFAANAQQQEDISLKSAIKIIAATSIQPQVTQPVNGEDVSVKTIVLPSSTSNIANVTNTKVLQVGDVDLSSGEKIIARVSIPKSNASVVKQHKANAVVYPSGKKLR